MGCLDLAADEAGKSLELSRLLNLQTNLAFCMKCMGRLERMRAENDHDPASSRAWFDASLAMLTDAVRAFSENDDFGSQDPEVGDCYSLLGRTCLSMGNVGEAFKYAELASGILVDKSSKDFLDLEILKGDLATEVGDYAQAHSHYRQVLDVAHQDDYQLSEIVARAFVSRGKLYIRTTQLDSASADLAHAATIWDAYDESELAGESRWEAYRAQFRFPPPILRILEDEPSFAIRSDACGRYVDGIDQARGNALSRRQRPDARIIQRCLKDAREDHALRRQPDLFSP